MESSIGIVTALVPVIGYEKASMIAKDTLAGNRSIYELVLEQELLTHQELDVVLSPRNMVHPRIAN